MSVIMVVAQDSTVLADCKNVGVTSGSQSFVISPQTSTGSISWNRTTRYRTVTSAPDQLAPSVCLTAWFDWSTTSSHMDARAIRNCKSNTSYGVSMADTLSGSIVLNVGMQKWSVCNGNTDLSCPSGGTGSHPGAPGSHPGCLIEWNHNLTTLNMTTWYRIQTSGGTIVAHNGGKYHEPLS